VPRRLPPKQDLSRYPLRQAEQRLDRYAGCLLLRQLSAIDRIQHPARDGDLLTVLKADDINLGLEAAQSTD
jgi:hypothetical protein